jgi:putative membrane protein
MSGRYVYALLLLVSAIAGFFTAAVPFGGELAVVANFAVILFAIPALLAYWRTVGRGGALVLTLLSVFAIVIEAVSITTGFPYGFFTYGESMGWKLGQLVPWTVPFAWLPLVIGVVALVQRLTDSRFHQLILGVLGLLLTDFVLDPVAVSLNFWEYQNPGMYYGVPVSNFFGWIFSGCIGTVLILLVLKERKLSELAIQGYLAILVFWTIAAVTEGHVIPVIVGALLVLLVPQIQKRRFKLF